MPRPDYLIIDGKFIPITQPDKIMETRQESAYRTVRNIAVLIFWIGVLFLFSVGIFYMWHSGLNVYGTPEYWNERIYALLLLIFAVVIPKPKYRSKASDSSNPTG